MNLALPPGSTVVVTGANGYLASHTSNELLKLGYRVRGTVRSPKPWLNAFYEREYGPDRFHTVLVPDFRDPAAIESILADADGVVHLVSDFTLGTDINEVVPWSRQATLSVLQAASQVSSIRRVVLISSSMALYTPDPGQQGVVVDQDTWNMSAVLKALSPSWNLKTQPHEPTSQGMQKRQVEVYSACKMICEWEAWEWVRCHQPAFEFNTVVAAFAVGRILMDEIPGSTMNWVRGLLHGDRTPMTLVPPKWFVDVEDIARLFVIALLEPTVASERVFAFGESANWTDVLTILEQLQPENPLIPSPVPGELHDRAEIRPRARAMQLLREFYGQPGMTPLANSIARGIGCQPLKN
ncbi:NAD(P)-binding protein [Aspergillus japonicus CBS 114.51]|uniref:NAD(P)-binding protein n=1 Tax=Aspergillus japonicus CBS 114.51 TaxID=1448312 RepID=A0A8T8WWF6_ASPJA|nr:NAD(P)-binding protein [Aspergillus japonicus CBS 114.51]RAH80188.1 NAD(P)-binding protein [Aspergillus japonicus CBS 114.51]